MPVTLDGTQPAHTRVSGPGRLTHAYPDNSQVALCGALRPEHPNPPGTTRCAICEHEATRRHWWTR